MAPAIVRQDPSDHNDLRSAGQSFGILCDSGWGRPEKGEDNCHNYFSEGTEEHRKKGNPGGFVRIPVCEKIYWKNPKLAEMAKEKKLTGWGKEMSVSICFCLFQL